MPTYFFDVRTMTDTADDREGQSYPSAAAAVYEARLEALQLASDHLKCPAGASPPEAILIRQEDGRVLARVDVGQVVSEALSTVPGTRVTNSEGRSGLAIVVVNEPDERYAATAAFRHRGYLVHEVGTLNDAIDELKKMGAGHPLLRARRPIIFAALEEAEPPLSALKAARDVCSNIWVFLASNAQSRVILLPRRFTTRQIEDLLLSPAM
jgi:hypothetical protein